ncbi:MAG: hypothetical protein ABID64_01780 [Nitrospirota bacterium]
MPDLRRTIENVCYAIPIENSATRDSDNEEEKSLSQETHTRVETALEKQDQPKNPESVADILRNFATQLSGKQKRIVLDVARKTANIQDFGASKFNKTYKIGTNNIQNTFNLLFKELEKLGLGKIQTTELKKNGSRNNHYLILDPINDPSEKPKETNKKKIKNGRTQYEQVIRNLDFIPNKLHDILLFLALSSKYNNWVDYDEIAEGIKKYRGNLPPQIKSLKELLPKIGIKLLEEKTKKGKKYFHLIEPSKNNNKRKEFQEKEQKRKNPSIDHVDKMRRLLKLRMVSSSKTIKRNWPKRKPQEEWYYDDELTHTPRRTWDDTSN